eukprot:486940_1
MSFEKTNHNQNKSTKYASYVSNITMLSDECNLAKAYFDLKDYHRVIETLKNEDFDQTPYAFFLSCYAKYLVGEKKKEEEILESNNQLEKSQIINKNLNELMDCIKKREIRLNNANHSDRLDAFHFYIKGVCLRELSRDNEAIEALITCVNLFPYNWSAWRSLSELVINEKIFHLVKSKLLNHWICGIFIAEVMVETTEFYASNDILKYINQLGDKLSENTHILGQTALILYNLHRFDECIEMFEQILMIDPYRIELLDVYSNILYVKEKRKELSYLAHRCMDLNKYRAETCCIVGNYYGMYGMHEKAILYFERSLALNSNFVSCYVLMGHEYIEMRNETAAIECYRKSIDLNCRDYRGWYGLGQTYELLQMYTYAIFYYNKVCKLRPYDFRMWMALAACYKNLGNISMSIKSYQRAESIAMNQKAENIEYRSIILELAKLYTQTKQIGKSKKQYLKYIEFIRDDNKVLNDSEIEALIKLSEIALDDGNFNDAIQYSQRIIKYGPKGKDTANKILKQIRMYSTQNKFGNEEEKGYAQLNNDNNGSHNQHQDEDDEEDDMEISYIN